MAALFALLLPFRRYHAVVLPICVSGILLAPMLSASEPTASSSAVGQERGVLVNSGSVAAGYLLIAPFGGQDTFLIDSAGQVVHQWTMTRKPGQAAYLLEDGSLLRSAKVTNEHFNVRGGPAGAIQRIAWDGTLLWDYEISDERILSHHDVEPLPDGNVLVVVWEKISREAALAAGRDPQLIADGEIWSEAVLELHPDGLNGGRVVWEWHLWDHLVQDRDPEKPNYGNIADSPGRVDVNNTERPIADWIHMNSVDYDPGLDQILLCGRTFDELWVIDHHTTTEEAAGKRGDLLYRWGNPFAYFSGTPFDQQLFGQHDPHWIPAGLPGAGNILIFNNGSVGDQRAWSTVDEICPPVRPDGSYMREPGKPFGPETHVWRYEDRDGLFSARVSGAQRLPNGHTLICAGETGRVFEVTPNGKIVWDYLNPLGALPSAGPTPKGPGPLGGTALFRAHKYAPDHPAFHNRLP